MMGRDFDFDEVGKRMPYNRVPADFFDKITAETLSEAEKRSATKPKKPVVVWQVLSVAASVAVLLTIGYFMYTGSNQKLKEDKLIAETEATKTPVVTDTLLIPEAATPPATPGKPQIAVAPKAARGSKQSQKQQASAQTGKPETLEEILASISDEELLLLVAMAESEQYVYEQTIE